MHVRRINLAEDYDTLKLWWTRRGTEAPHIGLLECDGVIAFDDDGWVACGFLYEDKRGTIAMVEWEATNPQCGSALRCLRGLNTVFDFFEQHCQKMNIPILLSWTEENRGDGRLLERRKWAKCPGERHALMAFATHPEEATCQQ